MMSRRRFLAVAAAFAGSPAIAAGTHRWRGVALGAQAEIVLRGPRAEAEAALSDARRLLRRQEALFSLYRSGSVLSRLNRAGRLRQAPAELLSLLEDVDGLHRLTDGLFDPTVQPLWQALAAGGDVRAARARVGWAGVQREGTTVTLGPGQALTLNGIAQGYATDAIADLLGARGFHATLVHVGEYRGTGGPWRLGLSDPAHGHLGTRTLTDGAIATSSPAATPLPGGGHILHPSGGAPRWSTVSVEATRATLADGLSTALCLASEAQVSALRKGPSWLRRVTLVTQDGDIRTF